MTHLTQRISQKSILRSQFLSLALTSLALIALQATCARNAVAQSTNTFPSTGNVGIGTTNPQSLLQVGENAGYGATTGLLITNNLIGSQYDRAFQLAPRQTANPLTNSILIYALPTVLTGITVPSQYGLFLDGRQGAGSISSYAAIATGQNPSLGASNNTHLLLGSLAIPAGNYAVYDNTNYRSYFKGDVGIGTTTPSTKLHVAGSITVDGNINAKFQDVAEWVPASEQIPAGTVVVLDSTKSNHVISSTRGYDTRVAGVISEQPGIVLGERGHSKVLVATTGRVKIKVDASQRPIQVGDLLVTSDKAGMAMKSQPLSLSGVQIHRPGTLIGKALEPLERGSGTILVLLSLQ